MRKIQSVKNTDLYDYIVSEYLNGKVSLKELAVKFRISVGGLKNFMYRHGLNKKTFYINRKEQLEKEKLEKKEKRKNAVQLRVIEQKMKQERMKLEKANVEKKKKEKKKAQKKEREKEVYVYIELP